MLSASHRLDSRVLAVAIDEMKVPNPVTLRDAVREVIHQNLEVGHSPGRFIQLTENGEAEDLVVRCQNLVNDPAIFDILFDGVDEYPAFLALGAWTMPPSLKPGRGPKH